MGGFDCVPDLVECSNKFLQSEGINSKIYLAPSSSAIRNTKSYDGHIVGWYGYSLIPKWETRIRFLRELRKKAFPGTPILISFLHMNNIRKELTKIKTLADIFGFFKNENIELGRCLFLGYEKKGNVNYVRFF